MKAASMVIVLIGLYLAPAACIGQAVGRRISETTVGIFNNSDKNLNFELGLRADELKTYSISPQENWISPIFPSDSKPLFRIRTGINPKNKPTQHALKLNTKYMLFWNKSKKKWDITRIKVVNDKS